MGFMNADLCRKYSLVLSTVEVGTYNRSSQRCQVGPVFVSRGCVVASLLTSCTSYHIAGLHWSLFFSMAEKIDKDLQEVDRVNDGSYTKKDSASDLEVADTNGLRTVEVGLSPDQVIAELEHEEQVRILKKVDYRLVPLLAVLYL